MAKITSKTLFFTTSPRTPNKIISEVETLTSSFSGKPWNRIVQYDFMIKLMQQDNYEGSHSLKDPAFSARDRINRAPKALGFVNLNPTVSITSPGKLLDDQHFEEILLRQLLKFQLPSPYHIEAENIKGSFNVKPYLEIIRPDNPKTAPSKISFASSAVISEIIRMHALGIYVPQAFLLYRIEINPFLLWIVILKKYCIFWKLLKENLFLLQMKKITKPTCLTILSPFFLLTIKKI